MCDPLQDFQKQALPKMGGLTSYVEGLKKLTVFENLCLLQSHDKSSNSSQSALNTANHLIIGKNKFDLIINN